MYHREETMSDIQLSKSIAEVYDEFFVPALFGEWPAHVLDIAEVSPGQRVLDIACGTGVLARAAAERTGSPDSVVGIDLNVGMLEVARRNAPDIDWREGRAEVLPFPDASFDTVVSQFGLMFFQDRVAALREMLRVLRPGGRMVVAVWGSLDETPGYATAVDLLQRLFGEEVANGIRAPFCLGNIQMLSELAHTAELKHVHIETRAGTARFKSIHDWMYTDINGWVLAGTLDNTEFAKLLAAAEHDLAQFVTRDGTVAFPSPAHLISTAKTHT
jgi:SAM-dependent methyltransferase